MELKLTGLGKLFLPRGGPHYSFSIELTPPQLPLQGLTLLGHWPGLYVLRHATLDMSRLRGVDAHIGSYVHLHEAAEDS